MDAWCNLYDCTDAIAIHPNNLDCCRFSSDTEANSWQCACCRASEPTETSVLVFISSSLQISAVVKHKEDGFITKFLALDKCLPGWSFLQVGILMFISPC